MHIVVHSILIFDLDIKVKDFDDFGLKLADKRVLSTFIRLLKLELLGQPSVPDDISWQ